MKLGFAEFLILVFGCFLSLAFWLFFGFLRERCVEWLRYRANPTISPAKAGQLPPHGGRSLFASALADSNLKSGSAGFLHESFIIHHSSLIINQGGSLFAALR